MSMQILDFTPEMMMRLGAMVGVFVLLALLVASFLSRARVFCQYLSHMTGISLKPSQVRRVYKTRGRGGVRDLLIDLLIREDLADESRPKVTPDSAPDTSIYGEDIFS